MLSLLLLPPHTLPLLQRGVPLMGQSSMNCPSMGSSHGVSPSGIGCSSVGPPWDHKPCQQTCSSVGSSLHGSTGPGRTLLQHGLPTGSQPPSGIPLLQRGVHSMGCGWTSAPLWTSIMGSMAQPASPWSAPQAEGKSLLQHLEDILPLILLRPWGLQSCYSQIFSLFYPAAKCHLGQGGCPLLKYVIPEVLPPSLMGSALASGGSILEPAGTGSVRFGGSLQQLLTEAIPVASPTQKPCHANPVQPSTSFCFYRDGTKPQSFPSLDSGFSHLQLYILLDKITPAGLFSHDATMITKTLLVLRLKIHHSACTIKKPLFFLYICVHGWLVLLVEIAAQSG